jgi:hypothetical protein
MKTRDAFSGVCPAIKPSKRSGSRVFPMSPSLSTPSMTITEQSARLEDQSPSESNQSNKRSFLGVLFD